VTRRPPPAPPAAGQPPPSVDAELRRAVAASRAAQGLPATVGDPDALRTLSQLLRLHTDRRAGQPTPATRPAPRRRRAPRRPHLDAAPRSA
jgi:hypothetical protein